MPHGRHITDKPPRGDHWRGELDYARDTFEAMLARSRKAKRKPRKKVAHIMSEPLRVISVPGGWWRVQRKWFRLLWVNVYVNVGPDTWWTVDFETSAEAVDWIAAQRKREAEYAARMQT